MNSYPLGSLIKLTGTFTDANGAPADPTVVTLSILAPDTTVSEYSGDDLDNSDVGIYSYDLEPDAAGPWIYRWVGDGAITAASPDVYLTIEQTAFEG